MSDETARERLIEAVTGIEEDIARLYEAYANSQPRHEEFWFGLVVQEADHANLIHSLINHPHNEAAGFTPDLELAAKLKDFSDYLAEEKARSKDVSFTEALEVAVNIETSISKESFYAFFKDRSGKVNDIIRHLREHDTKHAQYLKHMLEKWTGGTE